MVKGGARVDLTGSVIKAMAGLVGVAAIGWFLWVQANERIPEPALALDHGFEEIAGDADQDMQDFVRCIINQIKREPSRFGSEAGFELRPTRVIRPGSEFTVTLATRGRIRQLELSGDELHLAGRAAPIPTRCRIP